MLVVMPHYFLHKCFRVVGRLLVTQKQWKFTVLNKIMFFFCFYILSKAVRLVYFKVLLSKKMNNYTLSRLTLINRTMLWSICSF